MVTSQDICENKMDNRGFKSAMCESIAVKEQRVYGSGSVISSLMDQRCTLKDLEINRDMYLSFNNQTC